MVEPRGFEPLTSSLRTRRSPNLAKAPPISNDATLLGKCGEWAPFRARGMACQGCAGIASAMGFGLFGCNQAATLRRACEQADDHALGSRHHSTGPANLHLASDRGSRAVLADCLQCGECPQPGRGDDWRIPLSHYRTVLAADTRIAA